MQPNFYTGLFVYTLTFSTSDLGFYWAFTMTFLSPQVVTWMIDPSSTNWWRNVSSGSSLRPLWTKINSLKLSKTEDNSLEILIFELTSIVFLSWRLFLQSRMSRCKMIFFLLKFILRCTWKICFSRTRSSLFYELTSRISSPLVNKCTYSVPIPVILRAVA